MKLPTAITTTAPKKTVPRVKPTAGSSMDTKLAKTKTHILAGLASGPSKKFFTPLAAPSVRTYAVRTAKTAANHPVSNPTSTMSSGEATLFKSPDVTHAHT